MSRHHNHKIRKISSIFAIVSNEAAYPHDFWQELTERYRKDTGVTSLLLVRCTRGSDALVDYLTRGADGNWVRAGHYDAFIGHYGLGKEREGDGKSPEGDFGVLTAFGILDDPGTALPYLKVKETTIAVDEDCSDYNRIIDTAETGYERSGERMLQIAPEYNYGMAMDFNPGNIFPLGSAIFFHCKGKKTWTGGCVAVDQTAMLHILRSCGTNPIVCIHRG